LFTRSVDQLCLFFLNLSPVPVVEDVSLGNEKSCLNYSPRDASGFCFKEIALQSGICNSDSVHHTFRLSMQRRTSFRYSGTWYPICSRPDWYGVLGIPNSKTRC